MNLTQQTYIPCTLLELEDGVINARKCHSLGNYVVVPPPGRDCIHEEIYRSSQSCPHKEDSSNVCVVAPYGL